MNEREREREGSRRDTLERKPRRERSGWRQTMLFGKFIDLKLLSQK